MTDNPDGKLKANSQAPKSMGGGANHPFEATPSLYLNEPEGIQANREQMGYSLGELLVEEGSELVIDTDMPELVVTGNIRAYYDGKGNIVVETPSAEQEELRLLRAVYEKARQVKEIGLGTWFGPFEQLEAACYELDVFHNIPPYSGAVGLPEGEGRLDEGNTLAILENGPLLLASDNTILVYDDEGGVTADITPELAEELKQLRHIASLVGWLMIADDGSPSDWLEPFNLLKEAYTALQSPAVYNHEQEELKLLREYYRLAEAMVEASINGPGGEWKRLRKERNKVREQLEAIRSPSHSGAVGLPEAGGRLDE